MHAIGNERFNTIWEQRINVVGSKPVPLSDVMAKEGFVSQKYAKRQFVEGVDSDSASSAHTAQLETAVRNFDVLGVLSIEASFGPDFITDHLDTLQAIINKVDIREDSAPAEILRFVAMKHYLFLKGAHVTSNR